MPKAKMVEEAEYALPKGEYFPAVLVSVTEKTVNFHRDGKDQSFDKWVWKFRILEGDYAGMVAYGETQDRITTREDNLVRQWAEALLGEEVQVGDEFDTDAVVDKKCIITVRHDKPRAKANGQGMFYGCPVDEVLPYSSDDLDEPPF